MIVSVWIVQWFDYDESAIVAVCLSEERALQRQAAAQEAATDKGLDWVTKEYSVDVIGIPKWV